MTLNILNSEVLSLFDQFTELIQGQTRLRSWEQHITIPPQVGEGSILRTHIRPDMEIVVTDLTYAEDMKLRIQEACPLFELSYCLSGDIYCEWDGKESYTRHWTGNVLFFEDELVYEEKKADVRHQMLEIRLSPQGLFHYAADPSEKHRMEAWLKRHKGHINPYPNTPEIYRCVSDMMNCSYDGALKRLYMESKAMELIALFGEVEGHEMEDHSRFLTRDDLLKLDQARELVLRYFEQPLSLQELSRRVGLNEFKLKKGFRERFDMTVFELVRKQRMEKALYYMEVQRMNIGEAAVAVGYSNVSNFTTAFRKIYGYNPSEYVKRFSHQI
ncbi:AraC family transcriptional regulator [Paenibacillus motobuensis]|uniref:helix-turn-helix transcriptional regulator n=1 Tax=Paenibacillus TaxID=44249 RepID=UPI0020412753|nr:MULTISPECIES: helix-turn-helix domain-containing protein [Paenibacillus]MCM3039447.1 AraC family transcriptional regulator [Paenibacillus lutimineralis]MCM3646551.1 AraC family transcriptional regulator [Paenibacillus motobuensis]